MIEAIVAAKAAIAATIFAALFALERIAPASPSLPDPGRLARNGVLWISLLALSPAVVLPLTAFAAAHPLWARPAAWSGAPALLADIVLLDLWAYFVHRAYHEAPLMRRLHLAHHLDERLDTTTAVRFHPAEVALSAVLRMPPIMLLAIPFAHVVVFEALLLAASFFHHSNVRLPRMIERALAFVIVTPSLHWVHHHAQAQDTNSNYAAIFSLWDPLFGTRSQTRRTPDMKIGAPGLGERRLGALLLTPFLRTDRG